MTPEALYWRGRDCAGKGDWAGALEAFEAAANAAPTNAEYRRSRGLALAQLGREDDAVTAFEKALPLDPDNPLTLTDLAAMRIKARVFDQATLLLRRALAVEPDHAEARRLMAPLVETAVEGATFDPDEARDPAMMAARALRLARSARVVDAIVLLNAAVTEAPKLASAWQNLLYLSNMVPGTNAAALLARHRDWAAAMHPEIPARPPFTGDPGRLRIGLVSGDLRRHAVGALTVRAVEALARRGHVIQCFAAQQELDDYTRRYRAVSERWHAVSLLPDDVVARLVKRERIDVLIDLSGHTARNRLGVFALRPAPLQLTWAGYVGTTGLAAIDGLIADAREVPEGEDACYVERVLRLPHGYVCWEPPDAAPEPGGLPARDTGHVTFGAFHKPQKLNEAVFAVWARILSALPGARLMFKYAAFGDAGPSGEVRRLAQAAGIDEDRLDFAHSSDQADMLAGYRAVDIALDAYPYAGGVTTLEAAWMGVPTVTLAGATFAGRHGASHLSAIGLADWIAADTDAYVARAIQAAQDLRGLEALRAELRARVAASPLCDAETFAGDLEAAILSALPPRAG